MNQIPSISGGSDKKGWQLENTVDVAIKLGIAGAIFYFWGSILPFIVSALDNTLHAIVVGLVLAAILYAAFDPRIRNLIRATYDIGVRRLTGFVVERDPIGIMRNYIDRLSSRKDDMLTQMTKLKGQKRKLKDDIQKIEAEAEMDMKRAQVAKSQGNVGLAGVSAKNVGRAKESLDQLRPLLAKMEKLELFLQKMYDSIGYMIIDITNEVTNRERLYNLIKASSNAIKSAAAAMGGDKDDRAMFEMATEVVANDVANRVGYIEQFITESTNFINGVDVDNKIYEDKGLDLIDKFEKNGMDWLLAPVGETNKVEQSLTVGQPGVINISPAGQPQRLSSSQSFFDE